MELNSIQEAVRWDVTIQQGSTFVRTMDLVGLDLTGLEFRGQIRREHEDTEVLADYTFEVTGTNTLTVSLTDEETEELPAERLVHDIELVRISPPFVARILEGTVRVTPEVTK
ncbi:MAG: hypothetical protein R6V05_13340 [Candidatus Brocadiia bacterium]